MKFEKISEQDRVWVVTRGSSGGLQHAVDPQLFAALHPGASAEEIADALIVAAGQAEVAETRIW